MGGDGAVCGNYRRISGRAAADSGGEYPALAADRAVPADSSHPAAQCAAVSDQILLAGHGHRHFAAGALAVYVLFAPWTLLLLPVTGIWYIVFLSQFLVYEQMDDALRIEELYDKNK